jgi:hypothetical protein
VHGTLGLIREVEYKADDAEVICPWTGTDCGELPLAATWNSPAPARPSSELLLESGASGDVRILILPSHLVGMEKMRWDRAKGETGLPSHGIQRENKHKYRTVLF